MGAFLGHVEPEVCLGDLPPAVPQEGRVDVEVLDVPQVQKRRRYLAVRG